MNKNLDNYRDEDRLFRPHLRGEEKFCAAIMYVSYGSRRQISTEAIKIFESQLKLKQLVT